MGKSVRNYKRRAVTKVLEDDSQKPRPLTPAEFTFCEWLAKTPVNPNQSEQVKKLREIFNPPDAEGNPPSYIIPVTKERLLKLKRRKEFQHYFEEMRQAELDRARAMFIKRMPEAVATHFLAMDLAMQGKDYRSIPAFTNPVLDRVLPKKSENAPIAAVKIELTQAQSKNMDLETPDIEVVEIEDDAS